MSEHFMLAHLVEPKPEGYRFRRSRNSWPLHITLLPWFETSTSDNTELWYAIGLVAFNTSPFRVTVGDIQPFGAARDIPVNVIPEADALADLHQQLLGVVRESRLAFDDDQWIDDKYNPHVTRHLEAGEWVDRGTSLLVDDFHLIMLGLDKTCRVVKQFQLGQVNE